MEKYFYSALLYI